METKEQPTRKSCYERALPDEPMFILLGRDPDAPAAIKAWAVARCERLGLERVTDDPQIAGARDDIGGFVKWREENDGRWREDKASAVEQPSEEMTSLAGKVLAVDDPMSGDPAALEQLIADAKSLAGAVLRLDKEAGQGHGA